MSSSLVTVAFVDRVARALLVDGALRVTDFSSFFGETDPFSLIAERVRGLVADGWSGWSGACRFGAIELIAVQPGAFVWLC